MYSINYPIKKMFFTFIIYTSKLISLYIIFRIIIYAYIVITFMYGFLEYIQ